MPVRTVEAPQEADAAPHAEPVVIDLSGYQLEPLHDDGELIMYRGVAAGALSHPLRVLVVAPARG